jgi:hypothetical protein
VRESVLIRINCDPPARLWGGVGDLAVAADDVETEDAIYVGGATIISAPDFQQLMNGTADRLDFTLSGVSEEVLVLAQEEAESVKGAALDLGTIRFDDEWQQAGVVTWEARFRCDTLSVGSQGGQDQRSRSITLSVGTDDTDRSRAPIALFTDADQRRRSSDDAFFSLVAGITAGTSRRFGPS